MTQGVSEYFKEAQMMATAFWIVFFLYTFEFWVGLALAVLALILYIPLAFLSALFGPSEVQSSEEKGLIK